MADDAQSRAQKLQEFLEHSDKRRQEFEASRSERKQEVEQRTQAQLDWAKKQSAQEDALVEKRRAEFAEWQKHEKERKLEIAEMLRKKKEEQEYYEKKQAEKAEFDERKKRYMKELRHANAMKMAKERRAQAAKGAKDFALHDAEHDYRRDKETADRTYAELLRSITDKARNARAKLDSTIEQMREQLSTDMAENMGKLFKEEKTAEQQLLHQFMLKEQQSRNVPMMLRTIAQQKITAQRAHQQTFTKRKNELETERNLRLLSIDQFGKKTNEHITQGEADERQHAKDAHFATVQQLEIKLRNDREAAYAKEKEILDMTLTDAIALLNIPIEGLDED